MLYSISKRLKEAAQYLDTISHRLNKDGQLASHVSLDEVNTDLYRQAVAHIQAAVTLLQQQEKLLKQYQQDEAEREEKEPANRLSRKISEKI